MKSEYDVTTFIKRYLALEDAEPELTDEGNLQPALYDVRFAYTADTTPLTPRLPLDFYYDSNHAFCKLSRDLVAFPSNMFGHEEICVMSKSVLMGLLDKSITDDQAQLPMDSVTNLYVLTCIVRELSRNVEGIPHGG